MLRFSHVNGIEIYDVFYGYIVSGDFSYEAQASQMAPIADWCVEQFGPMQLHVWKHYRNQIYIWDKDSIFAFKMRWC